jgi:hypothetical protein
VRALLRSPNRLAALALGVAFAGYGALSAVFGRASLGILFGGAAVLLVLGATLGIAAARRMNIGAGVVWIVLGYAGLFLIGSDVNVLGMIPADEVVLFAAATVHLAVGLGARRDVAALE